MRCFKSIAKLIKSKRLGHPKGNSQSELSHLLGYKNGQFISNVERALCNIPLKMLRKASEVLDIPTEDLKQAILDDHEKTLDNYLNVSENSENLESDKNEGERLEGREEKNAVAPPFHNQPELKTGTF